MKEKNDYYSVAAALLWGINYVAVKSVLKELPENVFMLTRFVTATGLLFLYLAATGESLKIFREDLARVLLLGVLGVGLYNIIWTVGIHKTTASNAALIISSSPFFAQLYSQIIIGQRISVKQWAFTVLAFFGIFLMVGKAPGANLSFHSQYFVGNMLLLAGALVFALYTTCAKPLLERYSPVKLNALSMALGLIVLIPYCISTGPLTIDSISWTVYARMLYIIVFGTAAAYVCWYAGVQKTGPVKVILFHYIVPVSSMVLGALFLKEPIGLAQILGGVLVLGGVIAAKIAD